MLLTKSKTPVSVMVAIWSLRSVPICLLVLMFVFNSGSTRVPVANSQFWFDTIAVMGIVSIIAYWNHLKQLHWNASFVAYLYILLVLILRNPYGILMAAIPDGTLAKIDWYSLFHSLRFGAGILAMGMCLEVLIFHLRQLKMWAWWVALAISILYVASIVFFFSGTLGIWSLLDPDTKQSFRNSLRQRKLA
jgi:hypothetical protein